MNLDHLIFFRTLARVQNYSKAAEELHTSQPNLSYAISTLEKELGTALFIRTKKETKLTEAGILYLYHIERALTEIDLGRQALQSVTQSGNHAIHIITSRFSIMNEYIASFQKLKESQTTSVYLSHVSNSEIIEIVENQPEKYDLWVTYGPLKPDIMVHQTLLDCDFCLVMPKDHPLSNRSEIDLRETENYPTVMIKNFPSGGLRGYVDRMYHLAGIKPNIIAEARHFNNVYKLVNLHQAIGICLLTEEYKYGPLVYRPISYPRIFPTFCINYLKNKPLSPEARSFLTMMIQMDEKRRLDKRMPEGM